MCQRVLGYSPTRGLDACHLDIKDPAAFLACLDMDNNPLAALRKRGNSFGHYSISFIMVIDLEGLVAMFNSKVKLFYKKGQRDIVVITTGTMDEWYQSIRCGCADDASYELRWIMNSVLARLEQAGFREIFSHLSKHNLQDGTFILRA